MFGHGKTPNAPQKIHRFFFLEIPAEMAAFELILWEQSMWYPKNCPVQYIRESTGELQVGTIYSQVIKRPFVVKNLLEVTRFSPGHLIERTYKKGILQGVERVTVEERSNGTRIDYELVYSFANPIQKVLWDLFFKRQFEKTMDIIMAKVKDALVKKFNAQSQSGDSGA